MATRTKKASFQDYHNSREKEKKDYVVATEFMSVEDKLKVLEEIGKPELIDLFKGWKPKKTVQKRRVPLDQKVTLAITFDERDWLKREVESIKNSGSKISMSQFVRNKAISLIDINDWRNTAENALKELSKTVNDKKELKSKQMEFAQQMDDTDDDEEVQLLVGKIKEIDEQFDKLISKPAYRRSKLTGRMSLKEAEIVKWRAGRLCITASDYMRMVVFGLAPYSEADKHLSLPAKQRFYISIIDVSENGWGDPPRADECDQCADYRDEIRRLREEVALLRNFA